MKNFENVYIICNDNIEKNLILNKKTIVCLHNYYSKHHIVHNLLTDIWFCANDNMPYG